MRHSPILLVVLMGFPLRASVEGEAKNWGLEDIKALKAKDLVVASDPIVVAVIDTGLDLEHPHFKDKIWKNAGEVGFDSQGRDKSNNRIDDDNNGFVDDVHGWNFVENTNKLEDHHGHGSHVSGIVASLAPVQIMVLKYTDADGPLKVDPVQATVRAVEYAVKMKAKIINYSSGGFTKSLIEEAAIKLANDNKVLFVSAAGNESLNSDFMGYYPASYNLPNILSVAASDQSHLLIPMSNFGARTVHVVAPGKDIVSALPGGKYGKMTGTSQATAFVSGVAALTLLTHKELEEPAQLIKRITQTGDKESGFKKLTKFETKVNAYKAVAMKSSNGDAFGINAINTTYADPSSFSSRYLESLESIGIPKP